MTLYSIKPDYDRPAGWQILNFFGIPIYVEPSFFMFVGLIFLLQATGGPINVPEVGLFIFVIFFSILIHELGHALTAKMFGCDSIRIAMVMFGGYATHSHTTRGKSVVISLAGPSFGLALGGAATVLYLVGGERLLAIGPQGAMGFVLSVVIFINFFWSLFNLLPIYPLDGGQALMYGLSGVLHSEARAMLFVARLSMALCVLVAVISYQLGFVFVAIFCFFFFMNNMRIMQALR